MDEIRVWALLLLKGARSGIVGTVLTVYDFKE